MAYTDIDKPSDYFNTKLYTGDGDTASNKTGVGFQPDFTWIKKRTDDAEDHALFDSVRGVSSPKLLNSNGTGAEETHGNNGYLSGFLSDGFSVATNGTNSEKWEYLNSSGDTFASWNWKETATAGFDIVAYTGNATVRTISHSLSAVPKMIIVKNRSNIHDWRVYHASLGATHDIYLSSSGAKVDTSTPWNDTEPTSSVFTVGTANGTNQNGDSLIAYLFAEKQGYSKFGSYTGNGNADGTFVYTGFKPAFVIIKKTNSTGDWTMYDNKRIGYNGGVYRLKPNTSESENTSNVMDLLSNGFKLKVSDGDKNGSGDTFIYMAFAENPFVTSTGIPSTAR